MAREDFIAVGVRLFAVVLAFKLVSTAVATAPFLLHDGMPHWAALYGAFVLLGMALCVFLWFFPLTVARSLLPVMSEPRSESRLDASVALSVGLTLIGVWLLSRALPNLLYWALLFGQQRGDPHMPLQWSADQIARAAATAAEAFVGLALVFGSVGLKRLIERFRFHAPGAYGQPAEGRRADPPDDRPHPPRRP